ncbi:MAG TPA: hypothetical protein VGO93_18070 [Candidatus Xenobia bacterium]|jgi:hypothetical protein
MAKHDAAQSLPSASDQGPIHHKVVRGEYLFKILRSHGLDEADAQVAMDFMARDPKGHGITSGSVHVVYPGDVVRLPTRVEIHRELTAPPPPAPEPAPEPELVEAARPLIENGSLNRLHELLHLVRAGARPSPAVPAARSGGGTGTSVPIVPALLRPRIVGPPPRLVGGFAPRPEPLQPVPRTASRTTSRLLDELPRHGEPFTHEVTPEAFNLHRPYCPEAPELWLGFHRCPNCTAGKPSLCKVVKLLAVAEVWDSIVDDFDPDTFEGFDTKA